MPTWKCYEAPFNGFIEFKLPICGPIMLTYNLNSKQSAFERTEAS